MKILKEEIEKLKGNIIENEIEEEAAEAKTLLEVNTSVADDYVSDEELKIEIHKKINEIDTEEKLNKVKSELEDRFGKLSEDLNIYMLSQLFEKYCSKLSVLRLKQNEKQIEITFNKKITSNIDGQKLFVESYKITPSFKFSMFNNCLVIVLNLKSLDKHYIYYLIELMEIMNKSLKN